MSELDDFVGAPHGLPGAGGDGFSTVPAGAGVGRARDVVARQLALLVDAVPVELRRLDLDIGVRALIEALDDGRLAAVQDATLELAGDALRAPGYKPLAAALAGFLSGARTSAMLEGA